MILPPILQVGDILISSDILTEHFCCDLSACKGQCCIEGDAGAPVTLDEVLQIEESLDACWSDLSASAQAVIDKQGVAYTDEEGDLVTSIVNGKDCVFTYYDNINDFNTGQPIHNCCLCALEKAARAKKTQFIKPISCALYPIREKQFSDGTIALNYHKWAVCKDAVKKGQELNLPVYRFLEAPLIRRFGQEWYNELCQMAQELKAQGYL
jgi:Fe-S-cluster containining protein